MISIPHALIRAMNILACVCWWFLFALMRIFKKLYVYGEFNFRKPPTDLRQVLLLLQKNSNLTINVVVSST